MKITYRKRTFIDRFKCIDKIIKINVIKRAFTQGDLIYFKKDAFNYLVLSKSDVIQIEQ